MRDQLWSRVFHRRGNNETSLEDEDDRSIVDGSRDGVFLSLSYDSSQTAELSSEDDVENNRLCNSSAKSLLLPLTNSQSYDATRDSARTTVRTAKCLRLNKAKSAWKKLANNVDDILVLQDSSSSLNQSKTSLEERAKASALRSGSELTLAQCCLAVVLYLLISVVAFSFFFDHLTIIDSCYFAVVTFTTIVSASTIDLSTAL